MSLDIFRYALSLSPTARWVSTCFFFSTRSERSANIAPVWKFSSENLPQFDCRDVLLMVLRKVKFLPKNLPQFDRCNMLFVKFLSKRVSQFGCRNILLVRPCFAKFFDRKICPSLKFISGVADSKEMVDIVVAWSLDFRKKCFSLSILFLV